MQTMVQSFSCRNHETVFRTLSAVLIKPGIPAGVTVFINGNDEQGAS